MRKIHYSLIFAILFFLFSSLAARQQARGINNSSIALFQDSAQTKLPILLNDTLQSDTIATDTISKKKTALDAPVKYEANDSIIFTAGNLGYLYGEGHITYQTIDLKSENITMSMDSSIVTATYGLDSISTEFGFPVFTDKDQTVEAKTMRYNFKTKKGFITNAITEQGEGYIDAEKAKRNADGSFFMVNGKYTTCDEHDHPHFYIMLTKAKVRPKKDVVTGPAYLVIEDLPLKMIGLPFAFFPFTDKYSSGVIMPSYGDELDRGFSLRDGGYYFAINDYVDLALTGEIYTKGSWGLAARSNYNKRYKFSGSFNASYLYTKYGEKTGDVVSPDYSVQKNFSVSWNHSQDAKANMYRTFSAGVDFRTSSYDRNQLNNLYSPNNSSRSSSVTISQRFPNSPLSLTAAMNINQTLSDSSVALTLPNVMITLSRIAPFKRKSVVGNERWYEKIMLSYSGDFRNSINTKEDKLFKSNLQRDWTNGMKHSIPVSATFNLFNYLNISPSFNYNERWYTSGVRRGQINNQIVPVDTFYRFKRVYDFNVALSFQTKLYGFYEPLVKVFGLQKIRHVFTPSISLSAQPDFSDPKFGFYESFKYIDSYGDVQTATYSPYGNNLFGTAPSGKQGNIGFNFQNNIEAKVKNANDSLVTKSLVDNLNISFSYNMMADSIKWSDINTSIRLKITKSLTVNLNAVFDPYTYDLDKNGNPHRVDVLRLQKYGTIGRLRSTGYSFSPSINQDTFAKWFGKKQSKEEKKDKPDGDNPNPDQPEDGSKPKKSLLEKKADTNEYDKDGYVKNDVKWNLSANYSMSYGYSDFNREKLEYNRKITHNLGLSGSIQPTRNWNFNFNTNYDFESKKFGYMSCSLTRNLHCWSLSASFIPVGPYKSYYVSLRVNSSMLQDLKYEQRGRSSSSDPQWY